MTRALLVVVAALSCGCGYHAVASHPDHPGYCVTIRPGSAADANASVALAAGVRDPLSRFGMLRDCARALRVVVELRRITVEPEGIIAAGSGVSARGARVIAIASARVQDKSSSVEELLVEGEYVVETPQESWIAAQVQADARAAASRRAGEEIGRRLLGGAMAGPAAP